MIKGIEAYNPGFLANLNSIENRLAKENNEISSGIRVQQPSDDPGAIAPILDTQNAIAQVTQVQKNLTLANTTAQTADSALQNASSRSQPRAPTAPQAQARNRRSRCKCKTWSKSLSRQRTRVRTGSMSLAGIMQRSPLTVSIGPT